MKPNGGEKLIMKYKQPPNMEEIESESSSLTDIAIDMLMKQLDKPAPAKLNTQDNHNISNWEREKGIFKYETSI